MADFTTLYTGKGLTTPLPSGEGIQKSQERLSDFILRAEELKLNVYRENAKEFQKNAQITPEFVLSDSARKNTILQITEFNKKYSKLFAQKASTGGLNDEDKLNMATEKSWIIAQNQNDLATHQRYQTMKQIVQSNPMKYSTDEFMLEEAKYINKGTFDLITPPIKAKSPDLHYNQTQNKVNSRETQITRTVKVNGVVLKQTETASGTEDEGRRNVEETMLYDDALRKGMIERFQALPETEKLKYLDVNKDNIISPEEAKDTNPITQWAQDTYWEKALEWDTSLPTGIPGTSTTKTPALSSILRIGSGTPVKYEAPEAQTAKFAGKDYDKFYLVSEWPNQKVSVNGITVLRQTGEQDRDVSGILELSLSGYIEDTDMFVFTVNTPYRGGGKYGKGDTIAIKRSDVPQYNDFEVKVGGKATPVKSLAQTNTPVSQTIKKPNPLEKRQ